jgi:hypothetical protein
MLNVWRLYTAIESAIDPMGNAGTSTTERLESGRRLMRTKLRALPVGP